ncbi:lectin C-type domain protein [Teladorsagia circumcincta]|uniref:Lectin C-type domain protein n=1 Tax=Teladorsagia circumcincta TaxID=45464 RepID=A0A2G9U6Z5_TELCI|nr:lectin C-type domain protein [Teladorsagia circumcincta]
MVFAAVAVVIVTFLWMPKVEATVVVAEHVGRAILGQWIHYETKDGEKKPILIIQLKEKVSTVHALEEECKNHGGTLASIHSKEENDFIRDLVNKAFIRESQDKRGNYLILGMHNKQWTDGTKMDFTNWDPVGNRCSYFPRLRTDCAAMYLHKSSWCETTCDRLGPNRNFAVCRLVLEEPR